MQREIGTIILPSRRRIAVATLARTCAPPWRPWPGGALARAERTADGRVHLVVVRTHRDGVAVTVTGVRAAQAEVLAPIASRIRRALGATSRGLRGTSAFEDAVAAVLRDEGAPLVIHRAIYRLGARCGAAPGLRAMPSPQAILELSRASLTGVLGSRTLAERLQALARAVVAIAPCTPSRS